MNKDIKKLKEAVRQLAEVQGDMLGVVKLQQEMIQDLHKYVQKRDEIVTDGMKKILDIWKQ